MQRTINDASNHIGQHQKRSTGWVRLSWAGVSEVQCKHVLREWIEVLGNVSAYELDSSVATRGGQSVSTAVSEPRAKRDVGTRRKLRCTQLESGCLSLELFLSLVDAG